MKNCENCKNSYTLKEHEKYIGCKVVDKYKNPVLRTLGFEGKCPYYKCVTREEELLLQRSNKMKEYIIKFAPLISYNHYSLQDMRTVRVFSELSKEEIELKFEEKCDTVNADTPYYCGVYIEAELLEEYLNNIPIEVI